MQADEQWYVRRDARVEGPIAREGVIELLRCGHVSDIDFVRLGEDGDWQQVANVRQWFEGNCGAASAASIALADSRRLLSNRTRKIALSEKNRKSQSPWFVASTTQMMSTAVLWVADQSIAISGIKSVQIVFVTIICLAVIAALQSYFESSRPPDVAVIQLDCQLIIDQAKDLVSSEAVPAESEIAALRLEIDALCPRTKEKLTSFRSPMRPDIHELAMVIGLLQELSQMLPSMEQSEDNLEKISIHMANVHRRMSRTAELNSGSAAQSLDRPTKLILVIDAVIVLGIATFWIRRRMVSTR